MTERLDYLDDRSHAYRYTGELIASIARNSHSVDVDSTTQTRWGDLMVLLREVDTLADTTSASHEDVINELRTFDRFREASPQLTPELLGPQAHNTMLNRTKAILELSSEIASASSTEDYISLRVEEALQSSELLVDSASSKVADQPAFQDSFMPTIRRLGICANLADSIVDLRKDYARGEIAIRPSLRAHGLIARAAIKHCHASDLASLFTPSALFIRGKAVVARARNRIETGITPDSTLGSIFHSPK